MQRSRPMSTRSGLPTAATYVFVNMIKKLRQDFEPQYFAAVFDVSAARSFATSAPWPSASLRKWNSKTQCFEEVGYEGYKAKREAMPRRPAPADSVHPPLPRSLSHSHSRSGRLRSRRRHRHPRAPGRRAGHDVFIVSSDKDMMQLVNDQVKVLNPQKDNLVLDAAKVDGDSRRAAREGHRRDGAARRHHRQHSRRARHRRQGQRRSDQGIRQSWKRCSTAPPK